MCAYIIRPLFHMHICSLSKPSLFADDTRHICCVFVCRLLGILRNEIQLLFKCNIRLDFFSPNFDKTLDLFFVLDMFNILFSFILFLRTLFFTGRDMDGIGIRRRKNQCNI